MNDSDAGDQHEPTPQDDDSSAVHLPGFLNDDDIGLGDAIKEVTAALGIRPCQECERRAARLNRMLVFKGRRIRMK